MLCENFGSPILKNCEGASSPAYANASSDAFAASVAVLDGPSAESKGQMSFACARRSARTDVMGFADVVSGGPFEEALALDRRGI